MNKTTHTIFNVWGKWQNSCVSVTLGELMSLVTGNYQLGIRLLVLIVIS